MLTYLCTEVPQLNESIIRRSDQNTQVVHLKAIQCFYSTNTQISNTMTGLIIVFKWKLANQNQGTDTNGKEYQVAQLQKQVYIDVFVRVHV